MSTTTLPVTPPQVRTDPVEHDVLRPRPRGRTIRREIVAVLVPAWHEPGDRRDLPPPPAGVRRRAGRGPARRLPPARRGGHRRPTTARLVLRLRRADRARPSGPPPGDGLPRDRGLRRSRLRRRRPRPRRRLGPRQPQAGPRGGPRQATRAAADSIAQRDFQPRQRGAHVREKNPSVNRWTLARQVVAATLGGLVLPFLALVLLHQVGLDVSDVLYWVLVGSLADHRRAPSGPSAPRRSTRPGSPTPRTGRPHAPAP